MQYLRRRQAAAPGVVDAPLRIAFLVRAKALAQIDRGCKPLHGLPVDEEKGRLTGAGEWVEGVHLEHRSTPMHDTRDVPIVQI